MFDFENWYNNLKDLKHLMRIHAKDVKHKRRCANLRRAKFGQSLRSTAIHNTTNLFPSCKKMN